MEEAAQHTKKAVLAHLCAVQPKSGAELEHAIETMPIPDVVPFRAERVFTANMQPTGESIESRDYRPRRPARVTQQSLRRDLEMEGNR